MGESIVEHENCRSLSHPKQGEVTNAEKGRQIVRFNSLERSIDAGSRRAKPPVRHPGDLITYEIKFAGSDAKKIKSVSLVLHARTTLSEDQSGFSYAFDGEETQSSGLGIFRPELRIPYYAATGEYYLAVKATAVAAAGNVTYMDGMDFDIVPIHVENPRKFLPPHITVTEQQ